MCIRDSLKALRKMQHEGKENCLSSELSSLTGIQDTTIRRDFTYLSKTDNFGQRGKGYDVKHLIDGLSEVLGLGLDESIILIGIGNLGSAILKYNRWQYTVGKIVCGYDQDKNKAVSYTHLVSGLCLEKQKERDNNALIYLFNCY